MTRTFPAAGSQPVLGTDLNNFNFLGVTPIGGQSIQQTDGSISLPISDGSGFGAGISSAKSLGGSNWSGIAFGGGFFMQAAVRFTPTIGSPTLPFPGAPWFESIDFLIGLTRQWQGATGIQRCELDGMQWPHNSTTLFAGVDIIDWFGPGSSNSVFNLTGVNASASADGTLTFTNVGSPTIVVGAFVTVASSAPSGTGSIVGFTNPTQYKVLATDGKTTLQLGTLAGGAVVTTSGTLQGYSFQINMLQQPTPDVGNSVKISQDATKPPHVFSDFNLFGVLWIPATATTKGKLVTYLNGSPVVYVGVHPAPNTTWNQFNAASPPPPIPGDTAGAILDASHMVLIFGTDVTCPMFVGPVEVWQASGANNLVQ